jgi:hypothetical protein
MTIDEVREIKERISLEACNLTGDELRKYYSKGATEIQKRIDAHRSKSAKNTKKPAVSS